MYGTGLRSGGRPPLEMRRLRPMGIGDILDETFRLYRENAGLFIATVAVVQVPILIVSAILFIPVVSTLPLPLNPNASSGGLGLGGQASIATSGTLGVVSPLIQLLGLIASAVMTGALAYIIANRYLGQTTTVGQAYRVSFNRIGRILLANIWAVVRVGVLVGALIALAVVTGSMNLRAVAVLAVLAIVPVTLYLIISWSLMSQAIVLEDVGGIAASRRSRHLIRGHWWKAFGLYAVTTLLLFVLLIIVLVVVAAIVGAAVRSQTVSVGAVGIFYLLWLLATPPIQAAATTLLFYDLKIRTEAFDLENMAQQATMAQPFPFDTPTEAPPYYPHDPSA